MVRSVIRPRRAGGTATAVGANEERRTGRQSQDSKGDRHEPLRRGQRAVVRARAGDRGDGDDAGVVSEVGNHRRDDGIGGERDRRQRDAEGRRGQETPDIAVEDAKQDARHHRRSDRRET